MFVLWFSLFDFRCVLLVVCGLLRDACGVVFVVRCLLFALWCVMFAGRCLLAVFGCLWFDVVVMVVC